MQDDANFQKEIKNNGFHEVLKESQDGSIIFEYKFHENLDEDSKILEEFEKQLILCHFNQVPETQKNPAGSSTFINYREDKMIRVNDSIYKKILTPGIGSPVDLERLKVIYDFRMYLEGIEDPFDSSTLSSRGIVCVPEDIEPMAGYYLALATMCDQEEAIFWISHEFLFGVLGSPPRIPPRADVLFYAKITRVEINRDKESDESTETSTNFEKLLNNVARNYSTAKEFFRQRNYQSAIGIYLKWIKRLESASLTNDDEEEDQRQYLIKMYQNLCLCYNYTRKPKKTCIMLRELERLKPINDNPKALFAKGEALMMLKDFRGARKFMTKAQCLIPNNHTIQDALVELDLKEKLCLEHDMQTHKMMDKFITEAIEIEKQEILAAERYQKGIDEGIKKLENLETKLEEFIRDFREDSSIKNLSLTIELSTHEEITLAEHVCSRYPGIELKGIQQFNGDKIFYYLSK